LFLYRFLNFYREFGGKNLYYLFSNGKMYDNMYLWITQSNYIEKGGISK